MEKTEPLWFRQGFFWLICIGFPILCIWSEQKEFPELSLDWKEFVRCLRGLVWFTVLSTAFLVGMAFIFNSFNYDGNLWMRVSEYFFWSFLQQIGLQIFLTRRGQKIFINPTHVSFFVSTLFAFIHFPNPVLMSFTWIGGFFWSYSFQKTPNLYALSFSHGWLAVASLYCIPSAWMHGLRIGPSYWNF